MELFSEDSIFILLIGFSIGYLFSIDYGSRASEKRLKEDISLLFSQIENSERASSLTYEISRGKKALQDVLNIKNRDKRIGMLREIKYILVSSEAQIEQIEYFRKLCPRWHKGKIIRLLSSTKNSNIRILPFFSSFLIAFFHILCK